MDRLFGIPITQTPNTPPAQEGVITMRRLGGGNLSDKEWADFKDMLVNAHIAAWEYRNQKQSP